MGWQREIEPTSTPHLPAFHQLPVALAGLAMVDLLDNDADPAPAAVAAAARRGPRPLGVAAAAVGVIIRVVGVIGDGEPLGAGPQLGLDAAHLGA